ncbi:hypothetical protein A2U01_0008912 [Trifolium medium]|uniref:Uncharacterized protein n=1 Tax=Trifolium medium TaxID=97028 RepID=A0A392MKY9_9FABA|nr:hypothetical protein [Trifolium medium]
MASLFLSSIVIFLSAVSAIEFVFPTGEPVIPVHAFHKTSNRVVPTGEPVSVPLHVYRLSEPVIPPKPSHVLPTGESVPVHSFPTNVPLPPTSHHVLPTGDTVPVPAIPQSTMPLFPHNCFPSAREIRF